MQSMKGRVIKLICIVLFVIFIDFVSKDLTRNFIPLMNYSSPFFPFGGIPVFQDWHGIDFSINYVVNRGGAWGIFANQHSVLLVVRIIAISLMTIYVFFFHLFSIKAVPMIFIIGGAVGNVIDCFLYGQVIDMFYFVFWGYSYPVFNLADSFIFIGVFTMVFQVFFLQILEKIKVMLIQKSEHPHAS